MTRVQKRLFVIIGALLLIMSVIAFTGKKTIQKEAERATTLKNEPETSVPISTLETTAAEFIGNGVVTGTDRNDPKLRDGGFEKVKIAIDIQTGKTQQPYWEIISPMAEIYKTGGQIQLWFLIHKSHDLSSPDFFGFLVRRPPPEMAKKPSR